MNKQLIILLVVASAALVQGRFPRPSDSSDSSDISDDSSGESFAAFETNEIETSGLSPDRQVFADFCLQTRDNLQAQTLNSTNAAAANLFSLFAAQLTGTIKVTMTEQAAAIEEEAEKRKWVLRDYFEGFARILQRSANTIASSLLESLNNVMETLNRDNGVELVKSACSYLQNTLRPEIEQKLAETKAELLAVDGGDDETREAIEGTTFENVNCVTTRRLEIVSRSCEKLLLLSDEQFEQVGLKTRKDKVEARR